MAHIDNLTAYIVARGENAAEVEAKKVEAALEYGYFHSETRMTEYTELPTLFCMACYGVYKQLGVAAGGPEWTGVEVSTNNYGWKNSNEIPYNSRKIFESFRPRHCF